ncbi:hypothetical protein AQ505_12955 [Pedobacter sp. PACM 27299]|uniref:hypothetical protein n=2 Tax=Pedobacter TaxID=84567 RepID=UPI0007068C11|nr:hypothetical protein [Pedobacter sp. PACM 27299]ALL06327.1 hypothetical protein AQ505_12955 [Pedobacter sp. PACM 27299]
MKEKEDSFTIEVDLLEGAESLKLLVIPTLSEEDTYPTTSYLTVLDGVTFAIVEHVEDTKWRMVEGAIDQQAIDKIGRAIDEHTL